MRYNGWSAFDGVRFQNNSPSPLLRAAACALLLSFGPAALPGRAALFPARGDDSMSSMGVFKLVVDPPFRSLLAPDVGFNGYPGYVSADGRLTSPVLLDFATTVGRSDPYARPLVGTVDVGSPTLGLQGYADYPYTPFIFGFAPAGTRELLTQIRSFALSSNNREQCPPDPRVPTRPASAAQILLVRPGEHPTELAAVRPSPSTPSLVRA